MSVPARTPVWRPVVTRPLLPAGVSSLPTWAQHRMGEPGDPLGVSRWRARFVQYGNLLTIVDFRGQFWYSNQVSGTKKSLKEARWLRRTPRWLSLAP